MKRILPSTIIFLVVFSFFLTFHATADSSTLSFQKKCSSGISILKTSTKEGYQRLFNLNSQVTLIYNALQNFYKEKIQKKNLANEYDRLIPLTNSARDLALSQIRDLNEKNLRFNCNVANPVSSAEDLKTSFEQTIKSYDNYRALVITINSIVLFSLNTQEGKVTVASTSANISN